VEIPVRCSSVVSRPRCKPCDQDQIGSHHQGSHVEKVATTIDFQRANPRRNQASFPRQSKTGSWRNQHSSCKTKRAMRPKRVAGKRPFSGLALPDATKDLTSNLQQNWLGAVPAIQTKANSKSGLFLSLRTTQQLMAYGSVRSTSSAISLA
jgi:hypothetical protein